MPKSKWTTPWTCKNCMNDNEPEAYLCEFCGAVQPDEAVVISIDGDMGGGNVSGSSNNAAGGGARAGSSAQDAIDLLSDDDDDEEGGAAPVEVKKEYPKVGFGEADDPPHVVEVERPDWAVSKTAPPIEMATEQSSAAAVSINDDDEVVFVSTTAQYSAEMTHCRSDCPLHKYMLGNLECSYPVEKYKFTAAQTANNKKYCGNCYCYVCQVPAPCKKWTSGQNPHCNGHKKVRWHEAQQRKSHVKKL